MQDRPTRVWSRGGRTNIFGTCRRGGSPLAKIQAPGKRLWKCTRRARPSAARGTRGGRGWRRASRESNFFLDAGIGPGSRPFAWFATRDLCSWQLRGKGKAVSIVKLTHDPHSTRPGAARRRGSRVPRPSYARHAPSGPATTLHRRTMSSCRRWRRPTTARRSRPTRRRGHPHPTRNPTRQRGRFPLLEALSCPTSTTILRLFHLFGSARARRDVGAPGPRSPLRGSGATHPGILRLSSSPSNLSRTARKTLNSNELKLAPRSDFKVKTPGPQA